MSTVIGNLGTGLTLQAGYPIRTRGADGTWQIEYLYWCRASLAYSLAPAHYSAPPGGVHTDLRCLEVRITGTDAPDVSEMRAIYRRAEDITPAESPDTNVPVRESAAVTREVPIDSDEAKTLYSTAVLDAKREEGYTTVEVATVEYTYTDYLSMTWSQGAVVANVGNTGTPAGMTGANPSRWRQTGLALRRSGSVTERRRTYLYNVAGW